MATWLRRTSPVKCGRTSFASSRVTRSRSSYHPMIPAAAGLPTASDKARAAASPPGAAESTNSRISLSARLTRPHFLASSSAAVVGLGESISLADPKAPPKVAAAVTVYTHNSHADVIVSRLLETLTLDGKGAKPNLQLVSLYVD